MIVMEERDDMLQGLEESSHRRTDAVCWKARRVLMDACQRASLQVTQEEALDTFNKEKTKKYVYVSAFSHTPNFSSSREDEPSSCASLRQLKSKSLSYTPASCQAKPQHYTVGSDWFHSEQERD